MVTHLHVGDKNLHIADISKTWFLVEIPSRSLKLLNVMFCESVGACASMHVIFVVCSYREDKLFSS